MNWIGGGQNTKSGKIVNELTAMQATAVYACVRVLSETVASLPLHLYRRMNPRGKEKAVQHQLYALLHDQPNPEMTSFTWREAAMAHLLLWGNHYSYIEWGADGYPKALWPIRPDRCNPERDPKTKQIVYRATTEDGIQVIFQASEIFHIPGLGFDGLKGLSPIGMMKEAIGLALATEDFGAGFFGNGTHVGGVLETDNALSDKAYERLKKDIESDRGLPFAHKMRILEEGLKYKQTAIPPEHAQFLETRKYQTEEIARIFRVPPHLIGSLDRATFNNIEHQSLEFVVHTVRPWLVRWEQSIKWKLLTPNERKKYFAEFLVDGLLRGDTESRYKAYAIGRQWGWLSADDVRELENMNPLPDGQGQTYLVPLNMIPAEMAGELMKQRQKSKSKGGE
ncbi:portal protein [Parageobacillus thermoglucosidasius]|uniref:phage portal protein n=1 Tax=Parageobacillus thermoglucosidasius TaxID=1426 RepID=UPI000F6228C3|nr:phage portal protein [Parageobacillus thermoglucosidasius]GCD83677.1 portal protein [Parageobacillus thermoglucosidasius]